MNYNCYQYSKREKIQYGVMGGVVAFLLLMLFYDNILVCAVLTFPCVYGFLRYYSRILAEKRRWVLTIQFKDAMESLVSALVAGYALENAVGEAKKDLSLMYEEQDLIMQEISDMATRVELNVSVEALMRDLGERSGVEDIITFSEILVTAKQTGGNLVHVMRKTATNISEKVEIRREIETLISGKKMEATVMTAVPILMILYLRFFSPGFLDPLYHNLLGIGFMTIALAVYVISFLWGQRIMKIGN